MTREQPTIPAPVFDPSWWDRQGTKPDPIHEACEQNPVWVHLKAELERACKPGYHNSNTDRYSGSFCETDNERNAYAQGYAAAIYDAARVVHSIEQKRMEKEATPE